MSEIPTPEGPSRAEALSKVSGPAIGLIVVGVINILVGLYNVVTTLGAMANPQQAIPEGGNVEGVDMEAFTNIVQGLGAIGIVVYVIAIILAVVVLMGGLKMKKLESFGLCTAASVLAMIPCISCCIIGLPIGIWALVVLNKPEVKSAFS